MPTPDRRTRVNVAVRTNHHQMLRHLAAAMETHLDIDALIALAR